jgi:hypothetical protein
MRRVPRSAPDDAVREWHIEIVYLDKNLAMEEVCVLMHIACVLCFAVASRKERHRDSASLNSTSARDVTSCQMSDGTPACCRSVKLELDARPPHRQHHAAIYCRGIAGS